MLVVITGIPGSGKTTVTTGAVERLKEKGTEYEVVVYGTVMEEIAREKNLVKHRDEMRKLPAGKQKEIQREAAKKIKRKSETGNVILDTHCTIRTASGYLPGLPGEILGELKPDKIVIVEVRPEDIAKRRAGDKSRKRDDEAVESMELHQQINRSVGSAYSVLSGAPLKIIENPQGELEKAVEEMIRVLE